MSLRTPPPDPLYTFRGNMGLIHSIYLRIIENDELLYVGTSEGKVHVWDLKTKRERVKHNVGNEACLSILHQDSVFITQLRGESIKFWLEIENCWQLKKIINHDSVGFCRIISVDQMIVLPDSDSSIKFYNYHINNEKDIAPPNTKLGTVMCLKYLNEMKCILVLHESGDLYLWDLQYNVVSDCKILEECPMAVDYCETFGEGVIGSSNDVLVKFKIDTKSHKIEISHTGKLTNPGVSSVAIRKDGKICALGGWDGRIRYFSMKTLKLLAVLSHHEEAIETVFFSDTELSFCNSGLLIVGGKDGRVSLWDLYTKL